MPAKLYPTVQKLDVMLNKQLYLKYQQIHRRNNSSGYTLIESLMALVVVGVLITSVAPMLALVTASRVQARRVNQATFALRSYVDGVKGGTLNPPSLFINEEPSSSDPLVGFKEPFFGFRPSTSLDGYIESTTDEGTIIDTNNDGFSVIDSEDLVIQAIRPIALCGGSPCPRGTEEEKDAELEAASRAGYPMVVRVYRADAFANDKTPTNDTDPSLETVASSTFIGGIGNQNSPLVSVVVEVYPSVTDNLSAIEERKLGELNYGKGTP